MTFEDGRTGTVAGRRRGSATRAAAVGGVPRGRRARAAMARRARRSGEVAARRCESISAALRRRAGADRRQLRRPRGRDPRHHRPQRRRQDSMLNCINGFYHPQQGRITFSGRDRTQHAAARGRPSMGIARTFQNVALFKGMSVLDNIMTGRNLQDADAASCWQALCCGPAEREEIEHREFVERIIDFLEIQAIRKTPVGPAALRPAEARGARPRAGGRARAAAARRADGGHERRGEGGHVPLHPRRQRRVRHHDRADRARHGRGDGHLRPRGRARLRHARSPTARPTRCARNPERDRRLPRRGPAASCARALVAPFDDMAGSLASSSRCCSAA